ncbi:MAG: 6-phosphogluconolactonase, partial [Gammaproteobacteria bacterium]|nr:6-phosphogluconolactonase [Gammaproteobacteria bacterium]
DGHFASIFPDSPQLKEAITSSAEVLVVTTPSSPLSRTTMTLDSLIKSDELVLLVFGEEKRKILSAPDEYTISHLLDASPVHVVWAP